MRRLSRRQMLGYATGSIAPGVFSTLPGLLLLYYLTDTLGVSAGLGGLIVLLPKIWDVLINPFVGMHSDRNRSRWGPRVPYIAVGSVVLAVTLAVLFAVPRMSLVWTCIWVLVAYTLCNTGYAIFETPYVAVPAEITDDYDERTSLNAWRMAILALGILLSGGLAPALVDIGGSGRAGYALMGVVVGLLVGVCGLASAREIARTPIVKLRTTTVGLREQLRLMRANRPFAILLGAYFGQTLAIGAQLAAAPYFATYTMQDKNAVSVLFIGLVGPALVVMPLWVRRSERVGKSRVMVESSVLYAAGSLALLAAPSMPHGVIYLLSAVLGIGFAGMQMVPYAMLPDTIDSGAAAAGEDDGQAGALSGIWIGGETLGFALGPTILAAILAIGSFHSTVDAHPVPQTHAALTAVRWGFAVLPPFLLLSTLPLLRRYRLDAAARDGDDQPSTAASLTPSP